MDKDKAGINKEIYFPHEKVRDIQDQLVEEMWKAVNDKKHLIAHAPTGLGKTASALAPAITYAIKNKKVVFFLTSRHTQHMIALETANKIKDKHGLKLITTDMIGKKWMCLVDNIDKLYTNEFFEYCKKHREEKTCEFYVNARDGPQKLTTLGKKALEEVKQMSPVDSKRLIEVAKENKVCPYEIALALSKEANIIVSDYFYIFNPNIQKAFFNRIDKQLDDAIVIADEGHNLPARIRDLASNRITSAMLLRAIKEAKKYHYDEVVEVLVRIQEIILDLSHNLEIKMKKERKSNMEMLVKRSDFVSKIEEIGDYEDVVKKLSDAADEIRELKKQSYITAIPMFLNYWLEEDEGFARIISIEKTREGDLLSLSFKCLDPAVMTKDIISGTHNTILMSGTLEPVEMYRDILGFPEDTVMKVFDSPFPHKNRLNLIVPKTTTQYKQRSEEQFKNIAEECLKISEAVPGNIAIFFPSYYIRDRVDYYFTEKSGKEVLIEQPSLTKDERVELLNKFKRASLKGAVLLACQSGSFGEGIDLPGDFLKGVVVVGLPLGRPDLETSELIAYFDRKFGKGWDYGYVFPAFSKILQSAGRCIRSEKDKGIIVFLDERFAWPNYFKNFPSDQDYRVSRNHIEEIEDFFG